QCAADQANQSIDKSYQCQISTGHRRRMEVLSARIDPVASPIESTGADPAKSNRRASQDISRDKSDQRVRKRHARDLRPPHDTHGLYELSHERSTVHRLSMDTAGERLPTSCAAERIQRPAESVHSREEPQDTIQQGEASQRAEDDQAPLGS